MCFDTYINRLQGVMSSYSLYFISFLEYCIVSAKVVGLFSREHNTHSDKMYMLNALQVPLDKGVCQMRSCTDNSFYNDQMCNNSNL